MALQWFRSYQSERKQSVLIYGVISKSGPLTCGVPRGSVLGPVIFIIGCPLARSSADMDYNTICMPMTASFILHAALQMELSVANMEALICDIRGWCAENTLILNDDKTEMLIIGSKYRQIPQIAHLHVGSSVITHASHVKTVGVVMDSNLNMEPHIDNIMKAVFFKICEISYQHPLLPRHWFILMLHLSSQVSS